MKRILPIVLLLLLLCACKAQQAAETTTESTTQPTQAVVKTYTPDSDIEQKTGGAVRQYVLEQTPAWILPLHNGVLVAAEGEQTALTVLTGTEGEIAAAQELSLKLELPSVWQTVGGIAFYDAAAGDLVFLDGLLSEVNRIQLPQDVSGMPAVSQDGKQAFYCVGQTVYSIDVVQKIARPVRTNTCQSQKVLGCYMNGAVVACGVENVLGQHSTIYISGEDGRLLDKDESVQKVYSTENTYFALRADGTVNQYIYGGIEAAPVQMNIGASAAYGALELGGIIGQSETEGGIALSFYNMKKTAAITLSADKKPAMVAADSTTGGVWILTEDGALLQWQLQSSPVMEDVDYTGAVYTAEAPDTERLAKCAERGDAIGKELGVVIRVYERALVSNDEFDITVEYQPEAINRCLDELETLLRKFPEKFLHKSVAGMIRICIVRDIEGQLISGYHWHDGDPFIILSVGMDIEQAFLDAFSYILDIHVLGNSSVADSWETLNPEGFTYGSENTVLAYLEGENRAFADRKGMQSVTDDRATVFYHAMLADNAQVFQSEIMQAKLRMLCQAIRDAWRLEQSTESFTWEQYLNEPLVYQG